MPREAKRDTRDTFEQLYVKLEEHVGKLEQGGLTLEEAIALYEEGMRLARECQQRLDDAELKIVKLREAFAPTSAAVQGAPDDDEYVDDEATLDDEEPFA